MDNTWILDIENRVATRIKSRVQKVKQFAKTSVTTTDISKETVFPTIYVHQLDSPEVGRTLDGQTINGINSSFQIEIYSNKSQAQCKEIAKTVLETMKDMRFEITVPEFSNESTTYRLVMRFSRTIGSGDTF